MDFERVSELFRQARSLSTVEELDRFLDDTQDSDAVCSQVRELMEHHVACETHGGDVSASGIRSSLDSAWAEGAESPIALPQAIGPYRILGRLGHGGMATVFRAEQTEPRREVALKVLQLLSDNDAANARFRQEAEVLARLHHENIAQIYDFGVAETPDGPRAYLTMELIEGKSLLEYARGHTLGRADRIDLVLQILEATSHAHQNGVIHRDLKPSNILVNERGRCKLLDFGIARVVGEDMHTATGDVVGTLRYMSPERLGGRAPADTRADVYAIGVIAYELLGERHPLAQGEQSGVDALGALLLNSPSPLRTVAPQTPADLATVVHKALDRDVERRYATADAFATDLRSFLRGQPVSARSPTFTYQLRMFVRRNKAFVGAVSIAVLALSTGLVTTLAYARRADTEHERANAHAQEVQRSAAQLGSRLAASALAEGRSIAARQFLLDVPADLRDWVWRRLWGQCDSSHDRADISETQQVFRVRPDGGIEGRAATPAERTLMASLREQAPRTETPAGRLVLIDHGATGQVQDVLSAASRTGTVPWDPTARLRHSQFRLHIDGGRGTKVRHRLQDHRVTAHTPRHTAPELLVATSARRVLIWSPPSGEVEDTGIGLDRAITSIASDPSDAHVAIGTADGAVYVVDLSTGDVTERLFGCRGVPIQLAFVNGGRHLVARSEHQVIVWALGVQSSRSVVRNDGAQQGAFVYAVDVAPDGQTIALVRWNGAVQTIDRASLHLKTLRTLVRRAFDVKFSHDGSRLAVRRAGSIEILDARSGETLHERPKTGIAQSLYVDPTRRFVLAQNLARGEVFAMPFDDDLGVERQVSPPLDRSDRPGRMQDGPVALGSDGTILARRTPTGWEACTWPDGATVHAVNDKADAGVTTTMLAHGTELIRATWDGSVWIESLATGTRRLHLTGHAGPVYCLALHPTDNLLASGGEDGTIRIWSLDRGTERLVLRGHTGYVHGLAFTPDGETLVSGSGDGDVRIWSARGVGEVDDDD